MSNIGRPSKLNEIVIATLEKAYSVGMTTKLSCEYAGVSTSTFFTWMQRGKYEEGTIYAELYQRVKKAESSHALANLALIQKAAKEGTWQASAWLLERKHGYQKQQDPLVEVNIDSRQISVNQLLQEIQTSDQELQELISRPDIDLEEE